MGLKAAGASRAGGDGTHNEDKYLVEEGLGLYLVCDGLSEAPAGEVAARIAAEALEGFIAQADEKVDLEMGWIAQDVVENAMEEALAALARAEQDDPRLDGLATTVTMLLAHRNFGVIGHRGDSRAYLVRHAHANQLTVDHELTETAGNQGDRFADFDLFSVLLKPNDMIILCTDGAESVVEDDSFIATVAELPARVAASRIVAAAHLRAPDLDATVVVVRVQGEHEFGWLELSRRPFETSFGHSLQIA